jgi:hypothetical protein
MRVLNLIFTVQDEIHTNFCDLRDSKAKSY